MDKNTMELIIDEVYKRLSIPPEIRVEASGRHVHLSQSDAIALFGSADLTIDRELSQPNQYLYKEKVMLIGPKDMMKEVAILGPCRDKTQIELSLTDARLMGIQPSINDSGDLKGASDIIIAANGRVVNSEGSVIIARRHIHMTPEEGQVYQVSQGESIAIRVRGLRPIVFEDVLVRISPDFRLSLHIDYDEANAVGLTKQSTGEIVR